MISFELKLNPTSRVREQIYVKHYGFHILFQIVCSFLIRIRIEDITDQRFTESVKDNDLIKYIKQS